MDKDLLNAAVDKDHEFRQAIEQVVHIDMFSDIWKLYTEAKLKWIDAVASEIKEQGCSHCGAKPRGKI